MKEKIWAFLIVVAGLATGGHAADCICWDQMNDTQRNALNNLNNDQEQYQYTGVTLNNHNSYGSCTCIDVTRMTTEYELREEWAYSNLSSDPNIAKIRENQTAEFRKILSTANKDGFVLDATVTLIQMESEYPLSRWRLEVVAKGRASDIGNQVSSRILAETGDSMDFKTLFCSGEPPQAPENGVRNWDTAQKYPGDKANYTCNQGFILSDKTFKSVCQHSNLNWTMSSKELTCDKGCVTNPPDRPFFTTMKYDGASMTEGSEVIYYCFEDYKSTTGKNGSSKCENGMWTPIAKEFACDQILCPLAIPQVPAQAKTDWDGATRYIRTNITYKCIEGYSPYSTTAVKNVVVTCLNTGNWTNLPDGYQCANDEYARRMGFFDDQRLNIYDYYEDGPKKENDTDGQGNWILIVTFPSVLALVLLILCCMCSTRTDSPLFVLCTGKTKNTSYIKV